MNTLLQIKVSDETRDRLEALLAELRYAYQRRKQDMDIEAHRAALNAKGKEEGLRTVANFNASQQRLRSLGLRLTMQNIVRMFLEAGLEKYENEIPKLLDSVGEHGVTRGRPKGT